LQTLFFDETAGMFVDVLIPEARPTGVLSAAGSYPLFLEIATDIQATRVATSLKERFLAPGGWLTTLETTSQQWDRPNGWAPLQWVTFKGLGNYGFYDLADTAATRWVENCRTVYRDTGRLLEKYDVEHIGNLATGGEYVVQDGFGWTNAILLKFMNHLDID
jgi:alpha,alpha-trehalase